MECFREERELFVEKKKKNKLFEGRKEKFRKMANIIRGNDFERKFVVD